MTRIQIPEEVANDLRYEDEVEEWRVVHRETVDQRRWQSTERVVFQCCDKHPRYFELFWGAGLTECQEDKDFVGSQECKEVFPVEKTVVVYE